MDKLPTTDEFMKAIKVITDDYLDERRLDQSMWDVLHFHERVAVLLSVCKDPDDAEKYANKEKITSIPEPYFTGLMRLHKK